MGLQPVGRMWHASLCYAPLTTFVQYVYTVTIHTLHG